MDGQAARGPASLLSPQQHQQTFVKFDSKNKSRHVHEERLSLIGNSLR